MHGTRSESTTGGLAGANRSQMIRSPSLSSPFPFCLKLCFFCWCIAHHRAAECHSSISHCHADWSGRRARRAGHSRRAQASRSSERATSIECAGAYVSFDGISSPVTQTFGLGLFEETTPAALDEIERFFEDRGAKVHHEVSPLSGVAITDRLCARGYRPIEMSSVMFAASRRPAGTIAASWYGWLGSRRRRYGRMSTFGDGRMVIPS